MGSPLKPQKVHALGEKKLCSRMKRFVKLGLRAELQQIYPHKYKAKLPKVENETKAKVNMLQKKTIQSLYQVPFVMSGMQ